MRSSIFDGGMPNRVDPRNGVVLKIPGLPSGLWRALQGHSTLRTKAQSSAWKGDLEGMEWPNRLSRHFGAPHRHRLLPVNPSTGIYISLGRKPYTLSSKHSPHTLHLNLLVTHHDTSDPCKPIVRSIHIIRNRSLPP
jgi:hypothetical protein